MSVREITVPNTAPIQSLTPTFTHFSGTNLVMGGCITGTINVDFYQWGNLCIVCFPYITFTASSTNLLTITGLPASMIPKTTTSIPMEVYANGGNLSGAMTVLSINNVMLITNSTLSNTSFVQGNTCGITGGTVVYYIPN